jgi:GTP:adenosylcobinamide-phosphate guanylyltransferase
MVERNKHPVLAALILAAGYSSRMCRFKALLPMGGENAIARVIGTFRHAGINRLLLCQSLGTPVAKLFRIGQDYGCVNIIEEEGERICVRLINGRPADLQDRALRNNP